MGRTICQIQISIYGFTIMCSAQFPIVTGFDNRVKEVKLAVAHFMGKFNGFM